MDTLSDVLRAIRLSGAIFFDLRAASPWVAETPAGRSIVDTMFPGSDHLMLYHLVVARRLLDRASRARSRCTWQPATSSCCRTAMRIRSRVRRACIGQPDIGLYRTPADRQLPVRITMGDPQAEATEFVCGFLGCDRRPYNPLLTALPRRHPRECRAGRPARDLRAHRAGGIDSSRGLAARPCSGT